jgi:hypothetical protein
MGAEAADRAGGRRPEAGELDIIDAPEPLPAATLHLPDDAGSVRVKIKKVGNADSLSPRFYVELPAWERRTAAHPW